MRTLFRHGRVFDGEAFAPAGSAVLVEDGRILGVGPDGDFDGADAAVVDAAGATILPGLIDCHVHLCMGAESQILALIGQMTDAQVATRALHNAQATLRGGVTSVRDLGGIRFIETTVRNEIRAGGWLAPTLLTSGRMVSTTGGHGWFVAIEADGVEAVRQAVRTNIKAGADVIKMMVTGGVMTPGVDPLTSYFTPEEVEAGIHEARRFGRRVAVHALGRDGVRTAVRAGAASVEHGFDLDDETIALMIEAGVTLVPTLSAMGVGERVGWQGFGPELAERAGRYVDLQRASVLRFYKSGGRIAMGTDAGTPLNHHGENAQELGFLAQLGMTAADVLEAATARGADLLGLEDRGRLKPGAAADLLVVEGDLAADLTPLSQRTSIRLILKDGKDVRRLLPDPANAWTRPLSLDDAPF